MSNAPSWKVTGGSSEYWDVAESVDVPPQWVQAYMEPGDIATRPVCRVKKSAGKERLALILAANDLLASLREYSLPYTDDELRQLADTDSGRGEAGPYAAAREIRRRAAIAKVEDVA